jgi:hypothetical protein
VFHEVVASEEEADAEPNGSPHYGPEFHLVEESRAMRAMASRRRYWYGHVCGFCGGDDGGVSELWRGGGG